MAGHHTFLEGAPIKLISRDELKKKLDDRENIKLVFTLGEWHFRAKHIPGSLHIETPEKAVELLDKNNEVIVYCAGGNCEASIYAYHYLTKAGFKNVKRYAGGIAEWEEAGYPLEGEWAQVPASGK